MNDYYKILESDRNATKQDIKKAYKKLALKYHPDVNKSSDASEKFKKISEAYEILGDDNKKRQYDLGGQANNFGGFENMPDMFSQFFKTRARQQNNRKVIITVVQHFTIQEMYVGCKKDIIIPLLKQCIICSGQGIDMKSAAPCGQCSGNGQIMSKRGFVTFTQTCPSCLGRGTRAHPCKGCNGAGQVRDNKNINVDFPKELNTSQPIRLNDVGGYVVHINPKIINNDNYSRHNYNLTTTKTLSYVDALLGCKYIQTLPDNTSVKVTVPECTQHNSKFRLTNKGFYVDDKNRGDLIVTYKINLPSKLKDNEKLILQNLKSIIDDVTT